MKKYQATIKFRMSDDFMQLIPDHREYINSLIEDNIIDQYAVTMESQTIWITFSAKNKRDVKKIPFGITSLQILEISGE